ncbi:hypothetical protein N656DRAFT_559064 [Canariomyces notabilis]|uniref:Secreted protein n=1 Tax=Canariomyces notabilis TaxID=2074819 RepID=A0AAN6QBI9_9PEZI|nr:hypothetical protein N656DRAFT_559064 [Canariomyces arenarius]
MPRRSPSLRLSIPMILTILCPTTRTAAKDNPSRQPAYAAPSARLVGHSHGRFNPAGAHRAEHEP